jgi:hypothetical protein
MKYLNTVYKGMGQLLLFLGAFYAQSQIREKHLYASSRPSVCEQLSVSPPRDVFS